MSHTEPSSTRFTERVHRVLSYAQEEASRRGGSTVSTLDILTAFAHEGHGLLARVFATWHLSFSALCHELGTPELPRGRVAPSGPKSVLEPDAELRRALQCAADEAAVMGRAQIGTEHLLLGILRIDDCAACKLLAKLGMHVDEVRARIVALTSLRVEHRRPDAPTGERPANALTETELRAAHGRVPIVLREVKPTYSESALERHVEGTVVLEAVVLPDGWVDGIRVVQSLDPGLDKAAVTALEGWQFAPATMADQPVPAIVTCELTFTLR